MENAKAEGEPDTPMIAQDDRQETSERVNFSTPNDISNSKVFFMETGSEEAELEIEDSLKELLRSINEETVRLQEVLKEENKLMSDLCISIRFIMGKLRISFDIPTERLPVKKEVKRIVLNEKGFLTLFSDSGAILHSAFLAEYPPRAVMTILSVLMPKLAEMVVLHRKRADRRIGFFRKLRSELKSIAGTITGNRSKPKPSKEQKQVHEGAPSHKVMNSEGVE